LTTVRRTLILLSNGVIVLPILYLLLDEIVHTSEYTYLPKDSEALCHTQNFQWIKDVDVHIVISGQIRMVLG